MYAFIKNNEIIAVSDSKDTLSVYDEIIYTDQEKIQYINGEIISVWSDNIGYYIPTEGEYNDPIQEDDWIDMYYRIMLYIYQGMWPIKNTDIAKKKAQKKAKEIYDKERKELFDEFEKTWDKSKILSIISKNEDPRTV